MLNLITVRTFAYEFCFKFNFYIVANVVYIEGRRGVVLV